MPAAEELALLVKVDEIDEQLRADCAGKAVGMPAAVMAGAGGGHADVAAVDGARTLKQTDTMVLG
jgi:hypothetical protein